MKVQLPNKEHNFKVAECSFCGLEAYLINPELDSKWTHDNLFYRSLIVGKDGEVLSSGWPKFFNYGEKPECYPNPEEFDDWVIHEKIDGTLVICDYVNERFSLRTRGTPSYIQQSNFKDFEKIFEHYPQLKNFLKQNAHLSLLFELVTPNNIIVLRPENIQFYFLGAINKNNLQVVSNLEFDFFVLKPTTYDFLSLSNITQAVKYWKGQEGVVLSYNKGLSRIKIKSDWYCWIHRIKSQLNSDKNLLELYVQEGMPTYNKFYKIIEINYDFELAEQLKLDLVRITNAGKKLNKKFSKIKELIKQIKNLTSRKEQASVITETYNPVNPQLIPIAFSFLDNKQIPTNQLINLLNLELKEC